MADHAPNREIVNIDRARTPWLFDIEREAIAGERLRNDPRAGGDDQRSRIGDQTGGRVAFFLETDDFWRDHEAMTAKGVLFMETPRTEPYATVAVFADLYGNLWDLLQPR